MKTKNLLACLSILVFFVYSCSEEELLVEPIDELASEDITPQAFQGKLLQNPYEISNIRRAYQKIAEEINKGGVKTGKSFNMSSKQDSTEIEPNYLYVRFDPKNLRQESRLKDKKRLTVIDYPLEYENSKDYHNSITLAEGEIPSYWTSFPIGKKLPNKIPYTILQEMYVPEKDPKYNSDQGGKSSSKRGVVNDEIDFMNHVLEEAYKITGNEDLLPEAPPQKKGESCETCILGINLRGKWNPSGNIQVWDDHIGSTRTTTQTNCRDVVRYDYSPCYNGDTANCPRRYTERVCDTETINTPGSFVPLVGAQVLIRDTWTLGNAITDNNGNFRFSTVRAKVRYLIQWERYQYSIRDNGGLFQAEDKGPKLYKQPWNHRIRGGRQEYRANIHQGAHFYYYSNLQGLRRPPNNFTNRQTKIRARETTGGGVNVFYLPYITDGIWPTITMRTFNRPSSTTIGITMHEIAHSTHAMGAGGNFAIAKTRLRESYAQFIELILIKRYYGNRIANDWLYEGDDYQTQTIAFDDDYTTFLVDLNDDFNQANEFNIAGLPVDNVRGYTPVEIEKAVFKRTDFSGVVRELQKLENNTENQLWNLRNQWGN